MCIRDRGYNTLGAWSAYNLFDRIPYTHTFIFRHEGRVKWRRFVKNHPDVFDPYWRSIVRNTIAEVAQRLKNDPYLIGYWLDNEMHWGSDSFDKNTLLETYMSVPYSCPGKQKVVDFLIERYGGDIKEFNRVWRMSLKSFDELLDTKRLGRSGWCIQGRAQEDVQAFTQLVAHEYFNFTTSVLKEYDPNHLILGTRFHCEGVPAEVIKECGRYCDVVSVNYYRLNRFMYDPVKYIKCFLYGSVPLDRWMKRYYTVSGRPLIIGEFSVVAGDSDLSYLLGGSTKIVRTQLDRAKYFRWYAENCLRNPYIVGYHWFAYVDSNDRNFGLVDTYDNPYSILVGCMTQINDNIYRLHGKQ